MFAMRVQIPDLDFSSQTGSENLRIRETGVKGVDL
jgi:hypothetical protein